MAGEEDEGAGSVAMGERDAELGGAGQRRGHAGHHHGPDARGAQGGELLSAAGEDQRVAALEADDALALAGEADEQRIDLGLGQAVIAARLADIVALGVLAGAGEDLGGDEPVMDDGIRRAEQALGVEGEELGIAGTGADEIDDPLLGRALHRLLERRFRRLFLPGEDEIGESSGEQAFEETPAGGGWHQGPEPCPRPLERAGERPEAGGKAGLEFGAEVAGEQGRGARGADRDRKRGAIDDGGPVEGREIGPIDDVDGDAPRLGRLGKRRKIGLWRIRPHGQGESGERLGLRGGARGKIAGIEAGAADELRAVGGERLRLVRGARAVAHDEDAPAAQVEKERKEAHHPPHPREVSGAWG